MTVRIVPTLSAMAGVYRLPKEGGPTSPRFAAYVELGRAGLPVSGYNPMTGKDVLGTVEALLDIDAEALVQAVADDWAARSGVGADADLSITVATPGMWTDRLATEIEHRLVGRTLSQVLVWSGDAVDADAIVAEAKAQLVRVAWAGAHGPPATVAGAAGQEGLAAAVAGPVPGDGPEVEDPAVAEALDVLGDDTALGTMVAVLYGDEAARALGWTPVGLADHVGLRHCAAAATDALGNADVGRLVAVAWSPGRSTTG